MNTSVISQRSNARFFFLSLAFAVALLVASGFFVRGAFSGGASDGVDASTKACLAEMRTNGFNPTIAGNRLSIMLATTMNIESLVYKSGVIIASCPAYSLESYCAGTGCAKPGVSFILKKKDAAK
ncbi:hypothetical protein KTD31_01115 [Burkholderia multivorans]|jgi:hypothetical protein|uniref:hypothetical protein n=1 Tax=Burkholderia multivorans TaxID=87883 RepID=UPI001C229F3A|nr:hypothetical protein [Burkholderia multivorans]MBU9200002.1 hypothetical protein [Burkholderia multivorans]MDN8078879.1 hypothetical protein [Burkholderia multivorans]